MQVCTGRRQPGGWRCGALISQRTASRVSCPAQTCAALLRRARRELASYPGIVAGRRVLEIGAGCGACGILAAKLGAAHVALSDYVAPVLALLRDCVHLNAPAPAAAAATGGSPANGAAAADGAAAGSGAAGGQGGEEGAAEGEDPTAWDPEDASECGSDDFGDLLAEAAGAANGHGASSSSSKQHGGSGAQSWDAPPMHIRFFDWQRDVDALQPGERAALAAAPGVPASTASPPGGSIETPSSGGGSGSGGGGAPDLGPGDSFDVVLGTDILYEWPMVVMLPAVLRRRLRPGGRALLCCAVREQVRRQRRAGVGVLGGCMGAACLLSGEAALLPMRRRPAFLHARQRSPAALCLTNPPHQTTPLSGHV